MAPGRERLLVDVGRVDLHALRETHPRRSPPRAASRACTPPRPIAQPGAQTRIASAVARARPTIGGTIDARHEVPRRRIAEEAGDVDQDRVEELRRTRRDRLRAAPGSSAKVSSPTASIRFCDPPQRLGALVAGEVEAAVELDVFEQRLEAVTLGSIDRLLALLPHVASLAVSRPSCSGRSAAASPRTSSAILAPMRSSGTISASGTVRRAFAGMAGYTASAGSCTIAAPPAWATAERPALPSSSAR